METQYNEHIGVMEVWVRRAERDREETQRALQALYARCAGKCFVAVYFSGREDLTEQTSWLLCSHERRQMQPPEPRLSVSHAAAKEPASPASTRKRAAASRQLER